MRRCGDQGSLAGGEGGRKGWKKMGERQWKETQCVCVCERERERERERECVCVRERERE